MVPPSDTCTIENFSTACEVEVELLGRAPGRAVGTLVARGPRDAEIDRVDTELVVRDSDDGAAGGSSADESNAADVPGPASNTEPPVWLLPLVLLLGAVVVGTMALARLLGRETSPDTVRTTWDLRVGAPDAVVVGHDGPLFTVQARLRRSGHESIE